MLLKNLFRKIKKKKIYTPEEVFSDHFMKLSDEIAKRCEENMKKPLPDWHETLRKINNNEIYDLYHKK